MKKLFTLALAALERCGKSSDHTEAATVTPEAKPNSPFCKRSGISPFMKNTMADPSMVPNNGINSPIISGISLIRLMGPVGLI